MVSKPMTTPTSPTIKEKTPSDLWTTATPTATQHKITHHLWLTDPVTIAATLFLLSGAGLGVLLGVAFIAALPFPLPIAVPVAWLVVYRLPWWMVRKR